jgi:hypothetical protein
MPASLDYPLDKEKALDADEDVYVVDAAPDRVIVRRFGVLGPLLSKLFASGVEARGIERVPEDQRESKNAWNKCVSIFYTCLSLNTL